MLTLSIIVPAFNEEEIVCATVAEIVGYMELELPDTSFELIVVDDGSSDNTASLVKDMATKNSKVRLISHPFNKGRGAAIRSGLEASQGAYIVCLDADLSYDPKHIEALLAPLINDEAEITLASAYHPDGQVKNVPFFRALVSRLGNKVLSLSMFGNYHTMTCIVRGFKAEAIKKLPIVGAGKEMHLEIVQKAELFNMRVMDVPAVLAWRDKKRNRRTASKTRISLVPRKDSVAMSHLAFTIVQRPAIFMILPLLFFAALAILSFTMLSANFVRQISASDTISIYQALRSTLIAGELTVMAFLFSVVVFLLLLAMAASFAHFRLLFKEMSLGLVRLEEKLDAVEQKEKRN